MGPALYTCDVCGKSFKRNSDLKRHQRTVHGSHTLRCEKCGVNFTRRDNFIRHMKTHHQGQNINDIIGKIGEHIEPSSISSKRNDSAPTNVEMEVFQQGKGDKTDTGYHENAENKVPVTQDTGGDCITEEEAINGNLKKITLPANTQTKYDPMTFLKSREEKIRSILKEELKKRQRIKFYITMQVRLTKTKGNQVELMEPFFHGRCHVLLKKEDIEESIRESMKKIFTSFLEFQREGSNWSLDKLLESTSTSSSTNH